MKPDEQAEFLSLLMATAELYERTPTKAAALLYWDTLKHLSLPEIKTAIGRHVRDAEHGKYFPKPADIIHFARPDKSPVLAWSEVLRTMKRIGAYESVQFEDGFTNLVIHDMGGWPWLCQQDIDVPWTQKEFERRYEAYRHSGQRMDASLPGLHEQNNRGNGFLEYVKPAVLIGEGGEPRALPEYTQAMIGE